MISGYKQRDFSNISKELRLADNRKVSKDDILNILTTTDEKIYGYFKDINNRLIIDLITLDNYTYLQELKFRISEGDKGDYNKYGYTMVYDEYDSGNHHGSWEFCYRLADDYNVRNGLYDQKYINSKESIHRHHIDGNKLNSNPDNIERLTNEEHSKLHGALSLEKFHTREQVIRSKSLMSFSYMIGRLVDIKNKYNNINKNIYEEHKYEFLEKPAHWDTIMNYCNNDINKLNYMIDHYDELFDKFRIVKNSGRVYCAGGWFSDSQAERLEAVRSIIVKAGFDVFFPKEEALCKPDSSLDWRQEVFEGNLKAINNCSFMVNITDEKDTGTLYEAGYASGVHKPIIYFAETLGGRDKFNLMLAQSGIGIADSRDELYRMLRDPLMMESIVNNTKYNNYKGEVE